VLTALALALLLVLLVLLELLELRTPSARHGTLSPAPSLTGGPP
jgi:hypothetical protein